MMVTFNFSTQQITIEGDAPELVKVLELAREVAPKLPEIKILTAGNGKPQPDSSDNQRPGTNGRQLPMREWARRLNLTNQVERITAIGYYMTKVQARDSFSPKEMSEWFTHCGFQKPSQMAVVIFDARKKYGYVESTGHGQCRLTTSGENLVLGKLEEAGGQ